MAQVSFPGVYVNEISSGSHTITGVATSIPVFVGMTKDGPINTPTTVLGFTDFTRTFSADTSQGELPDQVRQFFLNGGTQAIIVRIAAGAASSTVTLKDSAGTNVLVLQSISAGSDQNALRSTVDYNTATPESTFNLTLFRETLDSAGNPTDSNQETISNLSMNPADPRYVVNVLPLEAKLATALVPTGAVVPSTTTGGVSIGAALASDITVAIQNAITAAGGVGKFRVTLSNGQSKIVQIPTPTPGPLAITDVQAALDAQFRAGSVVAAEVGTSTTPHYLSLTVTSVTAAPAFSATGIDIQVSPAPDADISAALGLGAAQGGIEISSFASFRPVPSGIVATLVNGSDPIGNLITLGNTPRSDWASGTASNLTMTGPQGFVMAGSTVVFPGSGTNLDDGNAVPGNPTATSLLNVQQNLQALAAAINLATTNWHASLQGYRLAVIPTFGNAQSGPGNVFPNNAAQLSGVGPLLNVPTQPLGFTFTSGSDGSKPTETQYDAAYAAIASQVSIFNLLILPRSVGDTANDRSAFWGPASSFCLQQRAFLIMDLDLTVSTVTQALTAVKQARLGLVKDHAATYWPRLQVNPDGNPRNIDPSGTLAGIMARIDGTRGVWKAPAGLEASLTGVLGVTTKMSDAENGEINPEALNAIRVFPNGIVSWGARTMDGFDNSGDDDFKYIPVRRFELFIESSLVAGLRFAVFEPNAEPLWSTIRLSVTAFMNNLFRQGAFAGTTTRDSFFVKVDSETTTATDINLGIVNVVVGFAPLKPAEFVVITIQQQAGQVQV
jgi:phage tail sheath protein FI